MTEILLLGTDHFAVSPLDIFSPEVQSELEMLTQKLMAFAPDAVAVEGAAHQQEAINAAYRKFRLDDLNDLEKMKNQTLGELHIFGQTAAITYDNEAVQVGFRLAKRMGLPDVYAIDVDEEMDQSVYEKMGSTLEEALEKLAAFQSEDSQLDTYRALNSETYSRLNHELLYIRANEIGAGTDYHGAEAVAGWYRRNLKIFANLQVLAKTHSRIFVLYGAGHLQILRELIQADSRLQLVDTSAYL